LVGAALAGLDNSLGKVGPSGSNYAPAANASRITTTIGDPTQAARTVTDPDAEAKGAAEQAATNALMVEARWQRITQNDLENLPLGNVLMWASVVTILYMDLARTADPLSSGESSSVVWLHGVACCLYLGGRIGHTICYANQLQPWRTMTFSVGFVGMLLLAISMVLAASKI
jgi:uncharacterized MAPEG superfamily protein